MLLNISKNKLLINKNEISANSRKDKEEKSHCNHCGGLIRKDAELASCIMCARTKDHFCQDCSYNSIV